MLSLYNRTCEQCSELVTRNYSTSFSLGIRSLAKELRAPIYNIYGFVRFADEIVDTFHDKPKAQLLQEFKRDTHKAIDQGISLNPILHSFQETVRTFHIDRELIDSFLRSMEMDLEKKEYGQDGYEEYIYGSAEVVGLMCLKVFVKGDQELYDSLVIPARKLGSAFQKVNFLRDLKDDVFERGRVYFPGLDFSQFDVSAKKLIELDIERDFSEAYDGIVRLPVGARMGVYLAYVYYRKLFRKIQGLSPEHIKLRRVRVPNSRKMYLLLKSYVQYQLNVL